MGKVAFILSEFFRSFQQSILRNILLMVLFSMCIFMTVIMSSYYLDLGEQEEYDVSNYDEDGKWYYLMIPPEERFSFDENFRTTNNSRNVMQYYEKITNIEEHPVMSVNTYQYVLLKKNEVKELLKEKDCRVFQPDDADRSISTTIDDVSATYMTFKAAWLDARAYDYFGLKTAKGKGFTDKNMVLKSPDDCVPIVLGANYADSVSIGQVLNIARDGSDYLYKCKVVGILENNTKMLDFGAWGQEMIYLDSYIIFPFGVQVAYDTDDNKQLARYAHLDSRALWDAKLFLSDDNEFREVVEDLRGIAREHRLPALELYGTSMGLNLLRNESVESIRIMLMISVLLAGFTFYALFVTFYNKIQDNQAVYGIYLMNGCSTPLITIPFVMEIAVILIPSLFVCRYLLNGDFLGVSVNDAVINFVYILVSAAFLIGVIFLGIIIRNVDTEHLMRKKY